jgi:hypothetical protein
MSIRYIGSTASFAFFWIDDLDRSNQPKTQHGNWGAHRYGAWFVDKADVSVASITTRARAESSLRAFRRDSPISGATHHE